MLSPRLIRPLFAGIFVYAGYQTTKEPGGRVGMTQQFFSKTGLDLDESTADTLVRLNGAVMAGAGTTYSLSILPRLSSLALIGALVPTTLAGHSFWEKEEPADRTGHMIQFAKNAAIVGGLLSEFTRRRR